MNNSPSIRTNPMGEDGEAVAVDLRERVAALVYTAMWPNNEPAVPWAHVENVMAKAPILSVADAILSLLAVDRGRIEGASSAAQSDASCAPVTEAAAGLEKTPCPDCEGDGRVTRSETMDKVTGFARDRDFTQVWTESCDRCDGTGEVPK